MNQTHDDDEHQYIHTFIYAALFVRCIAFGTSLYTLYMYIHHFCKLARTIIHSTRYIHEYILFLYTSWTGIYYYINIIIIRMIMLVYVIGWSTVVFGINGASNAVRKCEIVRGEAEC